MDLQAQESIKRLAEEHGRDSVVAVLGAPDPESAEIAAETVVSGDPAFAGSLAGVQLGLDVYHILESEIRELVNHDVWEEQIGIMQDVLDGEAISQSLSGIRNSRFPT